MIAHLGSVGIVFEKVANDLVCLKHIDLVCGAQHQFENLVEEECIDKVPTLVQSVARLHRHVTNHEAPVVLEGRVEEIVQELLGSLQGRRLGLLDSTHVEQSLKTIEIVFKVARLEMLNSFVESLD